MIYKSRQVNLDPEPWVNTFGNRVRSPGRTDDGEFIHAPRPEFEPTRDPFPWLNPTTNYRHRSAWLAGERVAVWAPRREQFDTPVNRLLAFFRLYYEARMIPLAHASRIALDAVDEMFSDYTPDEIDHARKVLLRLSSIASV